MVWRSPYGFEAGFRDEQWVRDERERVREYQRLRRERFNSGLRALVEARPADLKTARAALIKWMDDGKLERYPMAGDLWLARALRAAGASIAEPRRAAHGLRLALKDERMLEQWGALLLRDRTVVPATLDQIHIHFLRWAAQHEFRDRAGRIGPRKLGAWLRTTGWQSSRRSWGVVFPELSWRRA